MKLWHAVPSALVVSNDLYTISITQLTASSVLNPMLELWHAVPSALVVSNDLYTISITQLTASSVLNPMLAICPNF